MFHLSKEQSKSMKFVPMPRLSPTMTHGSIKHWYIKPGDYVQSYQLVLDVLPSNLLDVETDSDKREDESMEIEILEDMYVADILSEFDVPIPVGKVIAKLCDSEDQLEATRKLEIPKDLDLYSFDQGTHIALWQGYVKHGKDSSSCGCS